MVTRSPLITAAVSVVVAAGLCACGHTANPDQRAALTVAIDPGHPGDALPADFLGLSFEASVLDTQLFDPARSNLPALLDDLGRGHLRFGGNSLDRVTAWQPQPGRSLPPWAHAPVTPDDLRRLGRLTAATAWRVDLGLGLGHPDATAAGDEARAAARLIGVGLATVEIGNEPDLLGLTYAKYRGELNAFRAAVAAAAPGVAVAGPDTAGTGWLPAFVHDEHRGLAFVTQHFYPLSRCGGSHPTIGALLSKATAAGELATVDAAVAAGRAEGLSVRLDETNSASCGGQDGVSNSLASALWIANFLLTAAEHGLAGVNVQGGLAACRGYTPLCLAGATGTTFESDPDIDPVADASLGAGTQAGGRLVAQPDFYGLLLVRQLEGGRWLGVRSGGAPPIEVFAVQMPDGSVRVLLDNPNAEFRGNLLVKVPWAHGSASVLRLTGPSLGATSGVRLGEAAVGTDGVWQPRPNSDGAISDGGFRLELQPASAALVTLTR